MKVFILHSTAGEGHKKIAEAIEVELRKQSRIKNVQCFDAFERVPKILSDSYPKTYFYAVRWVPKIWGFIYEFTDNPIIYSILEPLRRVWNWAFSDNLRSYLTSENPDVIVSTHFFAAQVVSEMRRKGLLRAKVITVITDVIPHSFWINPGTDLYWVMAAESRKFLIERGISENQIKDGGIPVNAHFLEKIDRTKIGYELGLVDQRLNLLFSSGSFGIGPTEEWLRELEMFGNKIQVMVVCGKNRHLYEKLSQKKFSYPIILMGFVDNMHELMSVSDFLIAKPGGSTTCESLVKSLPILITSPIPGQETRNAKWLLANQAAKNLRHKGDLKNVIHQYFSDPTLFEALKSNIAKIAKPEAASLISRYISEIQHG